MLGGANGIGADFVRLCCEKGASVCFGDVSEAAGEALMSEIESGSCKGKALFVKTDVTVYSDLLHLFDVALSTFQTIDCAVANAGIVEIGNWFDPSLTLQSIRQPATSAVLDVNLLGTLYFARIAAVYLRQDNVSASIGHEKSIDKSILLISSVAGFKQSPGLFVYQASKHGVLGLMRALRLYLPSAHGIRINAVCPWMTSTAMVTGVEPIWRKEGLPLNSPMDVANIMAQICMERDMNGKSMYVEGGRAWEIEELLDKLEPQWLGEQPSKSLVQGQRVLGAGSDWAQ